MVHMNNKNHRYRRIYIIFYKPQLRIHHIHKAGGSFLTLNLRHRGTYQWLLRPQISNIKSLIPLPPCSISNKYIFFPFSFSFIFHFTFFSQNCPILLSTLSITQYEWGDRGRARKQFEGGGGEGNSKFHTSPPPIHMLHSAILSLTRVR